MRNGALNVLGVSATTPVPLATLVVPRRGLHSAAMDTPDVFGTCSLSLAQGLGSTVQPRCLFQHFIPVNASEFGSCDLAAFCSAMFNSFGFCPLRFYRISLLRGLSL